MKRYKRPRRYKIARETWPLLGDFLRDTLRSELKGCQIHPSLPMRYITRTMLGYIDGLPADQQAALLRSNWSARVATGARRYAEGLAAFAGIPTGSVPVMMQPRLEEVDEGPDLVAREVRGFRTMTIGWAGGGVVLLGRNGGILAGPVSPLAVCAQGSHVDPPHYRCCGFYAAHTADHYEIKPQMGNDPWGVLVEISAAGRTIIGEVGFQTARYKVEAILLAPALHWLLPPAKVEELAQRFDCPVSPQ